jgi:hypothetical protein
MYLEEVGLRGQNMIISLGSIVNKKWGWGVIRSMNKHDNLHFDDE